ncbi:MAG TPA: hypothetical protein VFY64_03450 [Nitrososphaeraceae archaeon]|nr:hypothetical protein [Nitrososphaeraceae archaeon]
MTGTFGRLMSISAYCFKHTTAIQMPFSSYSNFIEFVKGKRDRNYNFY